MCVSHSRWAKTKRHRQSQGQDHFKVYFPLVFNIAWARSAHILSNEKKNSKQNKNQMAAEPVHWRPYKWSVYLNWTWITIYILVVFSFRDKIYKNTSNIRAIFTYSWEDIVTFYWNERCNQRCSICYLKIQQSLSN